MATMTNDVGGAYALLADMGTGKTLVAIAVAGRLFLDGHIKRLLIVAPASVCTNWPSEFEQFADYDVRVQLLLGVRAKRLKALDVLNEPTPDGCQDVLRVGIINYESTWRLEEELTKFAPDMIVCDESQRIKSPTSAQSKCLHRLGVLAKYRMIMTGTPIQNNVLDIWSQYKFLAPGTFHDRYYAFQRHYAVMGGFQNHKYLGPANLDELTIKTHSIAYRVQKSECLDLPDKIFENRTVLLEPSAQALYTQVKKESFAELENGSEVTAQIVLTKLLRLQQITGGFLTDDDGNITQVSTAKMDALADIVETVCIDECKKIVVFARFIPEVHAIEKRIADLFGPEGLNLVTISGDVPSQKRGKLIEQFQNDPSTRAFVGQLDACAEGITLTAADTMVYYSVNWNYAKYQQSQDRIHRISQTGERCLYLMLSVPGTIDKIVMAALEKKEDIAHTVCDNWRTYFTDEEE